MRGCCCDDARMHQGVYQGAPRCVGLRVRCRGCAVDSARGRNGTGGQVVLVLRLSWHAPSLRPRGLSHKSAADACVSLLMPPAFGRGSNKGHRLRTWRVSMSVLTSIPLGQDPRVGVYVPVDWVRSCAYCHLLHGDVVTAHYQLPARRMGAGSTAQHKAPVRATRALGVAPMGMPGATRGACCMCIRCNSTCCLPSSAHVGTEDKLCSSFSSQRQSRCPHPLHCNMTCQMSGFPPRRRPPITAILKPRPGPKPSTDEPDYSPVSVSSVPSTRLCLCGRASLPVSHQCNPRTHCAPRAHHAQLDSLHRVTARTRHVGGAQTRDHVSSHD